MADTGTTILNLPATVALNDTDVLPLARPSGTTAPGSDLGLSGAALKALFGSGGVSLLWQTGGVGGTKGYKAGQLLHNSAGVDFYYLADITGANATAEPLLTTSTAATNALVHIVGPPTALAPIYNLASNGLPVPYQDFNSAADANTGGTFVINAASFSLTRDANIGTTWIIGNLCSISINHFNFNSRSSVFTDLQFYGSGVTAGSSQSFTLQNGTLTNCSFNSQAFPITIYGNTIFDDCGTIYFPIIGSGQLILRNGTTYTGPALPNTITLINEVLKTVNGIAPDKAGNVAVAGGGATGGVFRGAWATATAYAQNDSVLVPAGS